jgi:hypothetical protein
MADGLVAASDKLRPVILLQCGRAFPEAAEIGKALTKLGRRPTSLVVRDRGHAQSDGILARIAGAGAVWIFTDSLFESFFTLFATQLAFTLRTNAKHGLPIIGVGAGAIAMGGLVLAHRVCGAAQYDLVSGLGWGQRVLIDAGAERSASDEAVLQSSVSTLSGLLGVDLASAGGIRVEGGRIESIGSEAITLMGAGNNNGALMMIGLEPGKSTLIAPPPFAPFETGMLSQETLSAIAATRRPTPTKEAPRRLATPPRAPALHRAPPPPEPSYAEDEDTERGIEPEGGRKCPMCKQFHPEDGHVEIGAAA